MKPIVGSSTESPSSGRKLISTEPPPESRTINDFKSAFMRASGLPLELSGKEGTGEQCCSENLPGFCQIIHNSDSKQAKAICGLFNRKLEKMALDGPHSARCFAGIQLSAVPIRVDGETAGYFKTGHVMPAQPEIADFAEVMSQLSDAGLEQLTEMAKKAWLATPVMDAERYRAFEELLMVFARQISSESPKRRQKSASTESLVMQKATQYIEAHSSERLTLAEVASSVGLSRNYFCLKFRESTGGSFTEYLTKIRMTKASQLLREPGKRIKEIAFESGFNSIVQFNRTFRAQTGMSPTDYRSWLLRDSVD